MANITVDGYPLDIDIRAELEEHPWHKPNWKAGKLLAASPFRDDRTPSFFVDLETGGWSDSGAYDTEYERGNLAKLLSFFRNETYEETVEYLVDTYGVGERKPEERIELSVPTLQSVQERKVFAPSYLEPYAYRNQYLNNRGIPEKIQRFMQVGYSRKEKAVVIPWHHPDGALANVKFRQIYGKLFWYARGGAPIHSLVYGIHKVYAKDIREAVICEAEIDALSWMTCGVFAVAIGGASISEKQLDILRRSPLEHVWIAMDNDSPGRKATSVLKRGLRGYVHVDSVEIPAPHKDANEALQAGVDLSRIIR